MKYDVHMSASAEADAREVYQYIAVRAPRAALRWFSQLEKAVASLEHLPARCARAPEAAALQEDVRQLVFGKYRILFTIHERVVHVLHIRHGARRPLTSDDNE